jgi:hypothetical protein
MGCAVASAAMLGEMSYDEALARWPSPNVAWTRDPHNLLALLEIVTETQWQLLSFVVPNVRVNDFASCPWPVGAWIQDAALGNRFGQWIVVDDQIVHDPGEPKAWAKSSYPLGRWFVGKVAQPVRPEALLENQTRRQSERIDRKWRRSAIASIGRRIASVLGVAPATETTHRAPILRGIARWNDVLRSRGYTVSEQNLACGDRSLSLNLERSGRRADGSISAADDFAPDVRMSCAGCGRPIEPGSVCDLCSAG